jgi:Leucine-rich repeat (LRR) protein
MVIDAEFCKSLPNVEVLDLRSNRLVEISPTIKAMMSIRVLKLDKNDLSILPEEVFDIIIMEELTFQ